MIGAPQTCIPQCGRTTFEGDKSRERFPQGGEGRFSLPLALKLPDHHPGFETMWGGGPFVLVRDELGLLWVARDKAS